MKKLSYRLHGEKGNEMGWTFYHVEPDWRTGKVDRKREMDDYMTWSENGYCKSVVLKSAMVGSVYYAAVHYTNEKTGKNQIYAAVNLTGIARDEYMNFGYKPMGEDMGPGYYDCPAGILDLLTEPLNEYAAEWRRLCREKIAKRNEERRTGLSSLPFGTVIEFTGSTGKLWRVVKMPPAHQFKTAWFRIEGLNQYYPKSKIPKNFTVVSRPDESKSA